LATGCWRISEFFEAGKFKCVVVYLDCFTTVYLGTSFDVGSAGKMLLFTVAFFKACANEFSSSYIKACIY